VPLEAHRVGKLTLAPNPAEDSPFHDASVYGQDATVSPRQIVFSSVEVQILNSFHNELEPTDANGDGTTSPTDALPIINWINERGAGSIKMLRSAAREALAAGEAYRPETRRFDTNGDGHCTHMDVLAIFNRVNANVVRHAAEREAVAANDVLLPIVPPNQADIPANSSPQRTASANSANRLFVVEPAGQPGDTAEMGTRAEAIEAILHDLVGPVPSADMLDDWFQHLGL
jgi:hypothetical protein